jgi:hypothetical protein
MGPYSTISIPLPDLRCPVNVERARNSITGRAQFRRTEEGSRSFEKQLAG